MPLLKTTVTSVSFFTVTALPLLSSRRTVKLSVTSPSTVAPGPSITAKTVSLSSIVVSPPGPLPASVIVPVPVSVLPVPATLADRLDSVTVNASLPSLR